LIYLLDSNVYIDSFNDPVFGGAGFRAFHREHLPRIVLSAVVVFELLVGARTPRKVRQLRRGLVEPFAVRRRLHVPTRSTWEKAAEVDRRLRHRGGLEASLARRSFAHDLLLAVTAREIGATIITRDLRHFLPLCELLRVRAAAPWP
jgi:predicted nucleic acid-binding protein